MRQTRLDGYLSRSSNEPKTTSQRPIITLGDSRKTMSKSSKSTTETRLETAENNSTNSPSKTEITVDEATSDGDIIIYSRQVVLFSLWSCLILLMLYIPDDAVSMDIDVLQMGCSFNPSSLSTSTQHTSTYHKQADGITQLQAQPVTLDMYAIDTKIFPLSKFKKLTAIGYFMIQVADKA